MEGINIIIGLLLLAILLLAATVIISLLGKQAPVSKRTENTSHKDSDQGVGH